MLCGTSHPRHRYIHTFDHAALTLYFQDTHPVTKPPLQIIRIKINIGNLESLPLATCANWGFILCMYVFAKALPTARLNGPSMMVLIIKPCAKTWVWPQIAANAAVFVKRW